MCVKYLYSLSNDRTTVLNFCVKLNSSWKILFGKDISISKISLYGFCRSVISQSVHHNLSLLDCPVSVSPNGVIVGDLLVDVTPGVALQHDFLRSCHEVDLVL